MTPSQLDDQEVAELWHAVRSDLLKRGADVHTAEDVAQDVWLLAVSSPPEERGRFSGWAHVVARRILQRRRRTERHRAWREQEIARVERSAPLGVGEDSIVLRCVDELPETYGTVLRLRFLEGFDVDEIAARLELHPDAVRARLARGLARLRSRIGSAPEDRRGLWGCALWLRDLGERLFPRVAQPRLWATSCVAVVFLSAWFLLATRVRSSEARELEPGTSAVPASLQVAEVLVAPGSGRTPSAASETPPGDRGAPGLRLAGIVRSPSGELLPGALVHAAPAGGPGTEIRATADARGHYEIAAGRHDMVWASAQGELDSARCYVLSVAEPSNLDLFLAPTHGRASVLVRSATGLPVAGARVLVNPRDEVEHTDGRRGTLEFLTAPPVAITGADGRADVLFPARARVELVVLPAELPAWQGQADTPEPGSTFEITLPRAAMVSGTCRADGLPCWPARVELLQLGGLVHREGTTESDGTFRFENLSPGEFVVRAGAEPRLGPPSARHEGTLAEGASLDLALALDERASIHGIVLDAGRPAPGSLVSLITRLSYESEGNELRTALTDAHGRFVFAGCRGTRQTVRVEPPRGGAGGAERTVRPGRELVFDLGSERAVLAPIELAFAGEGTSPRLVELRQSNLSQLVEPEPGTARFRSPPLPPGRYAVVAWTPELGAWTTGWIQHDPASGEHVLQLTPAGTLTVALDLPPGVRGHEVEVTVLGEGFNAYGFGPLGNVHVRRELVRDDEHGTFTCQLPPGSNFPLVVRGAGLAETHANVRVAAGGETRISLAPLPGIETRLELRAPRRYLGRYEAVHLDVQTPFGTQRMELVGWDQRAIDGGFGFLVWLPAAAFELTASTDGRGEFLEALEGKRSLGAHELDAGAGTPCVEIELTQTRR